MGQAGTVEFAEHLMGKDGRPKGVAFVRYSTQEEAQNAIQTLTGTTMPGKDGQTCSHTLEVDLWTGAKPQTHKGGAKGGKGGGWGGGSMAGMGWEDKMMMNMIKMMTPGIFGKAGG